MAESSRRAPASDSGASTVEAAILLPLLMLMSMVVVQAAIWFHTSAVVTTAANKGLDATRVEQGTADDGRDTTNQFLTHTAMLRNPDIQVQRSADTASITVSGDVVSLVFGVPFTVEVTADAPVERMLP